MPVLINFKICDNAKECNGIAVCPTGALSWDTERKGIRIDNGKCIGCGKCEKACEVDAISVASGDEEYECLAKEIDADPRKVSDLFIDRYGAQPVHPAFLIPEGKFQAEVLEAGKLTVAELFDDGSLRCFRRSIPIKRLLPGSDIKYRKCQVSEEFAKGYGIRELPALLFFENGELIGKIEGYFDKEGEGEMLEAIDSIVKNKKSL